MIEENLNPIKTLPVIIFVIVLSFFLSSGFKNYPCYQNRSNTNSNTNNNYNNDLISLNKTDYGFFNFNSSSPKKIITITNEIVNKHSNISSNTKDTHKKLIPIHFEEENKLYMHLIFDYDHIKKTFSFFSKFDESSMYINYQNDNTKNNEIIIKKSNTTLLGVYRHALESSIYVVYYNEKEMLGMICLQVQSKNFNSLSISESSIPSSLSFNKENFPKINNKPLLFKSNYQFSLLLFENNNLVIMHASEIFHHINIEELITPNLCIKYKIIDLSSLLTVDLNFLIIPMIYVCLDSDLNVELKYANVNVKYRNIPYKFNDNSTILCAGKKEIKFTNIYSQDIKIISPDSYLFEIKQIFNDPQLLKKSYLRIYENKILINLNNEITFIQRINYEQILNQSNYDLHIINLFPKNFSDNTTISVYLHNNTIFHFYSSFLNGIFKLYLTKLHFKYSKIINNEEQFTSISSLEVTEKKHYQIEINNYFNLGFQTENFPQDYFVNIQETEAYFIFLCPIRNYILGSLSKYY